MSFRQTLHCAGAPVAFKTWGGQLIMVGHVTSYEVFSRLIMLLQPEKNNSKLKGTYSNNRLMS